MDTKNTFYQIRELSTAYTERKESSTQEDLCNDLDKITALADGALETLAIEEGQKPYTDRPYSNIQEQAENQPWSRG